MKKLLTFVFAMSSCGPVVACLNEISETELKKALAQEPNAKAGCNKGEPCYCYDGVDFSISELKEVTEEQCVNDIEKPIWEKKSQVEKCDGEKDCQEKLLVLRCEDGRGFIDENFSEIYCTKLLGYEQKCSTVTYNKLQVDPSKKAKHDADVERLKGEAQAKRDAQALRVQKIKDFDLNSANTIAKLKELLKEIQEDYKAERQ